MSFKIVIWIVSIMLVLSVVATLYFGVFEKQTFYGTMIIIMSYIAGFIYLKIMLARDKLDEVQHKTIDYCWNRASTILQRFPGGTSVEWRQGQGRKSEMRYYVEGQKKRAFRSFFAYSSLTRQPVVVIYDMDLDDVARYEAVPSPQMINDMWYEFKPIFNPQAEKAMMMGAMFGRKGKKGKRMNMNFDFGSNPQDYLEPDSEAVDKMMRDGEEK